MYAGLGGVDVSRHKCLIYDGDPSEQLPVVVPLLLDGMRDNWRCLYLGSPDSVRMVESALSTRGVDIDRETSRGALVLSSDRSHLVDGRFDPASMIDELVTGIDDALRAGFGGLCATGDMRWELGDDENFDRLVEYEVRLERVFREKPLRGICQYHRDLLPARAVADALTTHRSTYIGDRLNRDNLFYVPPELLLEPTAEAMRAKHGEWMCEQIVRVLDAERQRDRALAIAQQSEAEQRRLAEQLAELNRGLEKRVAERTAELNVANRHLEAFSYSVAHDLRAPLRAIRSFAEMLDSEAQDRLDEASRGHLRRVVGATDRMSELIEALLDLSRVTRTDIVRGPVDLSAIACGILDELCARDPMRRIDAQVQDGLRAIADARLVRVVLENLLANSWKFTATRDRARIDVGVRRDGSEPTFFVHDNGVGFDAAHANKLFTPFQRCHGTDFPGTGVGLATVQRIVERHRGRIWAESKVGDGATFFFTLPD